MTGVRFIDTLGAARISRAALGVCNCAYTLKRK